jgi:hypothetical protein
MLSSLAFIIIIILFLYYSPMISLEHEIRFPWMTKNFSDVANLVDYCQTVFDANGFAFDRQLENIYSKSESRNFLYHDVDASLWFPGFQPLFNLTVASTIFDICNLDDSFYRYYSGNAKLPQFSQLWTYLQSHSSVLAKNIFEIDDVNIWIGEENVTAAMHYDGVYNYFIQIMGTKHVRLKPPIYLKDMVIYGLLHPLARQSRRRQFQFQSSQNQCSGFSVGQTQSIPWTCQDYSKLFEQGSVDDEEEEIIEVVLQPGDLLFIPPFWLHEVILSLESSKRFVIQLTIYIYIYIYLRN